MKRYRAQKLRFAFALGIAFWIAASAAVVTSPRADDRPGPPYSFTVGTQSNHPNGTQLFVEDVTVHQDFVEVQIRAINGAREAVTLNVDNRSILTDSATTQYRIMPPRDNRDLRVAEGGVLQGTLVFISHVAETADWIELRINPHRASVSDRTRTPNFDVRIPLAEAVAADGKKSPDGRFG
ncbi:hypothetical protein [Algihabitans albus]|uniref:hypothetical protein n=1 Tax=Algihabitans albus TaxID=2164067 RepID=UPI000E5C6BFE|nr:hypothetical protein [Algihabitans albus]